MSRKLSSTTKKIVILVLFFGIVGFIIQVIGVVRRDDSFGEVQPVREEVVGEKIVS